RPAGLMLQLLDRCNQPAVVAQKWQLAVDVARDQGITNKDAPRFRRIDASEMHAPPRIYGKTIERRAFVGHDLAGFLFPAGIRPCPAQQMGARLFNPARVDPGDTTCIQAGRFNEFSRHDPAPRLLAQRRARMNMEADIARALPGTALFRL